MKFSKATPILRSFDEDKAKEFYVDFLEFEVVWEHRFEEDAPLYMSIKKGDCEIHISEHYGDASPGGAVRIECIEIEAFHKILIDKNYKYARPGLEKQTWGCYEIMLTDPFRNRIIFYKDIEE